MKESDNICRRILLVEDEDLLRWSVKRFLEGRHYHVEAVKGSLMALERLNSTAFDVIVTDLKMENIDGLQLAAEVRKKTPETQVIIITGQGSKETVIEALRQGVWDYIEKPFDLELLLITIEKALEKSHLLKELVRLSRTDGLSGLYNQRHFYHVLETEMNRARRQAHPLALLLVDIDNFKDYNDRYGHLAGDAALVRLASSLKAACRQDVDVPFRYGGDEFVVLLPEADQTTALRVSERIRSHFSKEKLNLTLSIGVTKLTGKHDLIKLIKEADEAMYLAKQVGGNQAITFGQTS